MAETRLNGVIRALESGKPLKRVLRPTDPLAEFAVADHVDAGVRLLPNDFGHGFLQACGISVFVVRPVLLFGAQEFE